MKKGYLSKTVQGGLQKSGISKKYTFNRVNLSVINALQNDLVKEKIPNLSIKEAAV